VSPFKLIPVSLLIMHATILQSPAAGQFVKTLGQPTVYDIQPAGNGQFWVRCVDFRRVWTLIKIGSHHMKISLLDNGLRWTAAAYDVNLEAYPVCRFPHSYTSLLSSWHLCFVT
jgi:hypothetical protein